MGAKKLIPPRTHKAYRKCEADCRTNLMITAGGGPTHQGMEPPAFCYPPNGGMGGIGGIPYSASGAKLGRDRGIVGHDDELHAIWRGGATRNSEQWRRWPFAFLGRAKVFAVKAGRTSPRGRGWFEWNQAEFVAGINHAINPMVCFDCRGESVKPRSNKPVNVERLRRVAGMHWAGARGGGPEQQ